jgi:hypothetical protein
MVLLHGVSSMRSGERWRLGLNDGNVAMVHGAVKVFVYISQMPSCLLVGETQFVPYARFLNQLVP